MRLFLFILLLCALLLGSRTPARAQAAALPATYRADSLAAATDTAAALHRLFAAKRRLRTVLVGGTVVAYLVAVNTGGNYGTYNGEFVRTILYTPPALAVVLGEVLFYGRYSRYRETRALSEWEQHRLAPETRRHLRPRYFHPRPHATLF